MWLRSNVVKDEMICDVATMLCTVGIGASLRTDGFISDGGRELYLRFRMPDDPGPAGPGRALHSYEPPDFSSWR